MPHLCSGTVTNGPVDAVLMMRTKTIIELHFGLNALAEVVSDVASLQEQRSQQFALDEELNVSMVFYYQVHALTKKKYKNKTDTKHLPTPRLLSDCGNEGFQETRCFNFHKGTLVYSK